MKKTMEKDSMRAWACCIIITLSCIVAQIFSKKYNTVVQALMDQFGITLTQSSLVVSAISLGAVILAVPSGALATKFGVKKIMLIAMGLLIGGGIISVFAPNYIIFLGGRLIEGFGLAFTMVLGPAVMTQYFTQQRVGLAMGIQGTWSPVGTIVATAVGTMIVPVAGWTGLWWASVIMAAFCVVLIVFVLPADEGSLSEVKGKKGEAAAEDEGAPKIRMRDVFKNPAVWCLAFIMFGYTFINQGVTNYGVLYLQEAAGYTKEMSAVVSSLTPACKIFSSVFVGAIMLKIKSKPRLLAITLAVLIVISSAVWCYNMDTPGVLIITTFILLGAVQLFVPPTVNASVPEALPDVRFASVAMGVVIMIQKIGSTVSAPIITWAVDTFGTWMAAGVVTGIAIALAMAAAIILFFIIKKKQAASAVQEAA